MSWTQLVIELTQVEEGQTIVRGSDAPARHHEIELGAQSPGCLYSVSVELQYLAMSSYAVTYISGSSSGTTSILFLST